MNIRDLLDMDVNSIDINEFNELISSESTMMIIYGADLRDNKAYNKLTEIIFKYYDKIKPKVLLYIFQSFVEYGYKKMFSRDMNELGYDHRESIINRYAEALTLEVTKSGDSWYEILEDIQYLPESFFDSDAFKELPTEKQKKLMTFENFKPESLILDFIEKKKDIMKLVSSPAFPYRSPRFIKAVLGKIRKVGGSFGNDVFEFLLGLFSNPYYDEILGYEGDSPKMQVLYDFLDDNPLIFETLFEITTYENIKLYPDAAEEIFEYFGNILRKENRDIYELFLIHALLNKCYSSDLKEKFLSNNIDQYALYLFRTEIAESKCFFEEDILDHILSMCDRETSADAMAIMLELLSKQKLDYDIVERIGDALSEFDRFDGQYNEYNMASFDPEPEALDNFNSEIKSILNEKIANFEEIFNKRVSENIVRDTLL